MAEVNRSWMRRSTKLALILLVLAGLGLGGWFVIARGAGNAAQVAGQPSRQPQTVPVLAATAEAKDFPIMCSKTSTATSSRAMTR